jgi:hypothetical protein
MSDLGKMRVLFSRLWRRSDGASAVEFSLVAMPLILTLLGALEVALILFVNVMLEGAIRDSARYGITGFTSGGVDRATKIREIIEKRTIGLVDMTKVQIETLIYQSFSDIGKPEPFTDSGPPFNGVYDVGETFADINGNSVWDADMGAAGAGGPGAVVVYKVKYDWPLLTGLLTPLIGRNGYITLSVSTAVRNEPFPGPVN